MPIRSDAPTQPADTGEFMTLAQRFRPELLAHCYRMLGSPEEAEDLVQETYLQAWRAYERFEGRSSLRTWLYRIATNACLRALEQRGRRPLPSGLSAPLTDFAQYPTSAAPITRWLQPIPDHLLAGDPASIVDTRGGVRLALVAAMQLLPARQRAVLILREVIQFSAAETALTLGITVAAVNSALQRARAALATAGVDLEQVDEPPEPQRRALLDRYVDALTSADFAALHTVLHDDAVLEMPPQPDWFAGRDQIVGFLASLGIEAGTLRMVRASANGQAAVAEYRRGGDGRFHAYSLQVLGMSGDGISHIVAFCGTGGFPRFDLPTVLDS
ncbi:sigma-70 family RNA polymerase sigma factor [Nocardia concava]|uniref:sigma-70 family RNA polymerase sigma factor n=1 Tax=Nocardia concava TaxID=257281 RepID=UPI0002FC769F|nr:sigma-70 family RNA polymerase sigma factor [Nocardia concava]